MNAHLSRSHVAVSATTACKGKTKYYLPITFTFLQSVFYHSSHSFIKFFSTSHSLTMLLKQLTAFALTLAFANATLDPALSNSKGRCPKTYNW